MTGRWRCAAPDLHRQHGMARFFCLTFALLAALQPGVARARCAMTHAAILADRCGAMGAPVVTRRVALGGNLSADAPVVPAGFVADGTYGAAFRSATFPISMNVVDATGRTHALLVFFTRTEPASASVNLAIDAGDTGETPGTLVAVAPERTLHFGTTGRMRSRRRLRVVLALAGGAAQALVVDLASMTMQPGPSGIGCVSQDGCALVR